MSELIPRLVNITDVLSNSYVVVVGKNIGKSKQEIEGILQGVTLRFQLSIKHFLVEEILQSNSEQLIGQTLYVYDTGELESKENGALFEKGISLSVSVPWYKSPKTFFKLRFGDRVILFLSQPRIVPAEKPWDPWKISMPDAEDEKSTSKKLWALTYANAFESMGKKKKILKIIAQIKK